ncbi:MAG: hypothetical protein FWG08_02400 [Propionibacteriaceae bacterium]|nr:hypothetical protein [Propionibacteriaceae bacterium]
MRGRVQPVTPGPLFDDEVNEFLESRMGWVSRRRWDPDTLCDEWVYMPTVGYGVPWPIQIECDGYGFVATGTCLDIVRDSLNSERVRFYSKTDLENLIDDIETWDINLGYSEH